MEISTPISWLSALEMEDLMLFQEPYDIHQSLDEIMSHNNMDHQFMPLNMNQPQLHPPLPTSAVTNTNDDVTKQPTTTTTAMTNTTKCSKPTRKHPKVQIPTPSTCFPVILNFGSSMLSKEDENDHEEEHVSSLVIDEEEVVFSREDALHGNCDDVIDEEPPAKRKYSRKSSSSSTTCTKEHIMSERRRREKLSQRFAALSALVPGLKRMDKTSILSEAINRLKELQEKIKYFEEDGAKRSIESVMLVKKTQFTSVEEDDHSNSCNEYLLHTSHRHDQLPEIEAKLSNNNILIKITCEKRDASLSRILSVFEKYGLSVSTVHATPFGDRTLDVTVIAQMEKEFDARLQDVLQDLSKACSKA